MDILAIAKDFGFPIALCGVLLLAIRHMMCLLVKAYTDRIRTLEGIVASLQEKIMNQETDRLHRADKYAETLKDLAVRYATAMRESNELTRLTLEFLRKLTDSVGVLAERPCMAEIDKGHKVPSSAEIPSAPKKVETDREART